jgi:SAM-dependent methyltransferase
MKPRIFKFGIKNDKNKIDPSAPKCSVCDYQGEFKMPSFRKQKVLCPTCNSLERQRFVYLAWNNYIKNKISSSPNILHIAKDVCIEKLFKATIKSTGSYRCCDLDPIKRGVLNIDITRIPLSIQNIDIVYASHVLEHIVDDDKAISEIYRILNPGGLAIILVPQKFSLEKTYEDPNIITPEERLKHFGDKDHVRYYGLDFIDRLVTHGFTVDIIALHSFLTQMPKARQIIKCIEPDAEKDYNLSNLDIIYLCWKLPTLITM